TAVDPLVARVVPVIELHRLLDRILHAARIGRARVGHEPTQRTHSPGSDDEQRDLRRGVVPGPKEWAHPCWLRHIGASLCARQEKCSIEPTPWWWAVVSCR